MSDLFTWREEADAAKRVAQAEEARAAAERARRYAPHGEVRARQARLEAATRAALAAEVELARIQAAGRPE
ncbi:hypothetical protein [Phenylobacterium sp.]|uniref:hypothetical protein n=1 Tax=Phenylobacterium sp. TaxID=1871053 RepID=UPI002F40F021